MIPAFKEWAYVIDALGKGYQKIILRKGGIHEETGDFKIDFQKFILLPTDYHQARSLIKPDRQKDLSDKDILSPHKVRIRYFAQINEVKLIKDWITLKKLNDQHVWKEEVVKEKFNRWNQQVHLLILDVYKLPEPAEIDVLPEYGGCKSWTILQENIEMKGRAVSPG